MSVSDNFFKDLESAPVGRELVVSDVLAALAFNDNGLVPAVAQDADSGEVLMLAWMSRESLEVTLRTGDVTYYSRSRRKLWRKGETSGNVQSLRELRVDCDGDALLLLVDQTGPACHTNRRSCFYISVSGERAKILVDPQEGG